MTSTQLPPTNLYPYRVRSCNTASQVSAAITFYHKQLDEYGSILSETHIHNMRDIIERLDKRMTKLGGARPLVPLEGMAVIPIPRKEAYRSLLQLIPRLLEYQQPKTDWSFLTSLFTSWIGVLKNNGVSWNITMYSEKVQFPNCYTRDEMIAYLLHEVLISGLHHPKQVIKQINLCLRLIKLLQLQQHLQFLPPTLQ